MSLDNPDKTIMNTITRRDFIIQTAAGTASLLLPWELHAQNEPITTLVKIQGGTPERAFSAAMEALGGISQFSGKGRKIVIKPNIGWDRAPDQGADTDPELVATIVQTFIQQDGDVHVFDNTCNTAQRCYRRSGIEEAAKRAGAKVSYMHEKRFDEINLPGGTILKSWPIYRDYLEADLRINVPILKHHSLAGITMGFKNLMGVMGGSRSNLHIDFDRKLIDITSAILPELTVLDARRVLLRNGPQGGNLDDVRIMNTLIVGFDPVAVDAEGARLFGRDPYDLPYLVEAEQRGLGFIQKPAGYREITLA